MSLEAAAHVGKLGSQGLLILLRGREATGYADPDAAFREAYRALGDALLHAEDNLRARRVAVAYASVAAPEPRGPASEPQALERAALAFREQRGRDGVAASAFVLPGDPNQALELARAAAASGARVLIAFMGADEGSARFLELASSAAGSWLQGAEFDIRRGRGALAPDPGLAERARERAIAEGGERAAALALDATVPFKPGRGVGAPEPSLAWSDPEGPVGRLQRAFRRAVDSADAIAQNLWTLIFQPESIDERMHPANFGDYVFAPLGRACALGFERGEARDLSALAADLAELAELHGAASAGHPDMALPESGGEPAAALWREACGSRFASGFLSLALQRGGGEDWEDWSRSRFDYDGDWVSERMGAELAREDERGILVAKALASALGRDPLMLAGAAIAVAQCAGLGMSRRHGAMSAGRVMCRQGPDFFLARSAVVELARQGADLAPLSRSGLLGPRDSRELHQSLFPGGGDPKEARALGAKVDEALAHLRSLCEAAEIAREARGSRADAPELAPAARRPGL